MAARIGVGIAGSGFVARFHVQSWRGVRDADITAIYSRNRKAAGELASVGQAESCWTSMVLLVVTGLVTLAVILRR